MPYFLYYSITLLFSWFQFVDKRSKWRLEVKTESCYILKSCYSNVYKLTHQLFAFSVLKNGMKQLISEKRQATC